MEEFTVAGEGGKSARSPAAAGVKVSPRINPKNPVRLCLDPVRLCQR